MAPRTPPGTGETTTGVLSFETNTQAVPNPPKDWSDLLKPEYKGKIASPVTASRTRRSRRSTRRRSPAAARSTTPSRASTLRKLAVPATSCGYCDVGHDRLG
jgi:hypothetical protein